MCMRSYVVLSDESLFIHIVRMFLKITVDYLTYRIRQNVRGGKLSRFSRILAKRECFTIETFPALQLENNYRSQ